MPHLIPGKSFIFLLADVARLFRTAIEKEIEIGGLPLTSGGIRVLAHIATYGGLRQSALAELMNIEPMTLSTYVDCLQTQGLVTRMTDSSDRRAKIVLATQKGRTTLDDLLPILNAVYQRAVKDIPPEKILLLEEGLSILRKNLSSHSAY